MCGIMLLLMPQSHIGAGSTRITSGTIRRVNRVAAVMVRGDPCWSWNVREGPWGSGRPTRQFWEVQNCRVRP